MCCRFSPAAAPRPWKPTSAPASISARSWYSRRRHPPRDAAVARLACAFGHVSVAIDHLQVRQAPKSEQRRPRRVAMLAPHLEQRHMVVDLGGLPQPAAALGAAPRLQAAQQRRFAAWRVPELPGDPAGAVPGGVLVRAAT